MKKYRFGSIIIFLFCFLSFVRYVQAERYALLVGIDHYNPSLGANTLATCINDANSVRNIMLLADPKQRWQTGNITAYTDSQATKTAVRNALSSIASRAGANDVVVYFQSSHGGQYSGEICLLLEYDDYYWDYELAQDLTAFNSETKVIVILDACNSAGMFMGNQSKNYGQPSEWPIAEKVMEHYRKIKARQLKSGGQEVPAKLGSNIAFMTAADYNEVSWCTYGDYSMFAKYLILGCSLDSVDTNNDNEYQFYELFDYASTQAEQITENDPIMSTQHAQSYNDSVLQNTSVRAVKSASNNVTDAVDNDYDGDGKSDIAVYDYHNGYWYVYLSASGSVNIQQFGGAEWTPCQADFDGDGKTDAAVYHENTGFWYILCSTGELKEGYFGGPGLTPVPADYDGDGKADLAVYDFRSGNWYIFCSGNASGSIVNFGGDYAWYPAPADYDGDGIDDVSVYDMYWWESYWFVLPSSTFIPYHEVYGGYGKYPVPADYDGNGSDDMAVYSLSEGKWEMSSTTYYVQIYGSDWAPVIGDYDGDGKTDNAIYFESEGNWMIYFTESQAVKAYSFGGSGYIPVQ
jgi:hypothetical protein